MDNITNILAFIFILQFCWSYYWNCYRRGYTMDVWHFSLLNLLIIYQVMLPFSRSDLNVFALGPLLHRTQAHVTESYLISALGYAGVIAGGSLWRIKLGVGFRRFTSAVVEVPARWSLFLLDSRTLLIWHGVLAILMDCTVLLYYFKTMGFGFNLRGMLLTTPWLRPLAQFAAFYSVLIGSYALARFYLRKERSMLALVIGLAVTQIFFGERANISAMVLMTITVMFLRLGRRLKLWWLLTGLLGTLVLAFLLDALRQPNYSLQQAIAGFVLSVFYGNSFSDMRDFAIVLSFWDGHYLFGLTYLAGLISFIPRYLSTFRDTWAYGVVTAGIVGLSPTEHPGLRVGLAGEAFLNFGLPGVLILGLLVGATIRLVDLRMKQALRRFPSTSMVVFSYLVIPTVLGAAVNSSAASTVYTILLIFAISWCMFRISVFLKITV